MKTEAVILFAIAIGCLIVAFYFAQGFKIEQWFDQEGIHFKCRNSSVNYTWEQLKAIRSEYQ